VRESKVETCDGQQIASKSGAKMSKNRANPENGNSRYLAARKRDLVEFSDR
jgi:hypothetical protein